MKTITPRRCVRRLPPTPHGLSLVMTLAAVLLLTSPRAKAQEEFSGSPVASSSSTVASEVPQVPGLSGLVHGLNAGFTLSGLHDSQTGWATLAQPAVSLSVNRHLSFDVTAPVYLFRLAESRAAKPRPGAFLVAKNLEAGDITFGLHLQFAGSLLAYQLTVTATAPTGDTTFGLSSGRPTFDATNHFEHEYAHFTPNIELGVGDSSTLVNRLVTKSYTSLGALAHFQTGIAFPLPLGMSFETNAYEQLPIGDQKIYRSRRRRGKTTTYVAGIGVAEDNGFITSLDVPVKSHTTFSTYYSRSLRQRDDVVSIGMTYILRGTKPVEEIKTHVSQPDQSGFDALAEIQ